MAWGFWNHMHPTFPHLTVYGYHHVVVSDPRLLVKLGIIPRPGFVSIHQPPDLFEAHKTKIHRIGKTPNGEFIRG